jgi:hypothetical protein
VASSLKFLPGLKTIKTGKKTEVSEPRIFENLVFFHLGKTRCSSMILDKKSQQMSTRVFFSSDVCMNDNDHRQMSIRIRLEYHPGNKMKGHVA